LSDILLGFEVDTGEEVYLPLGHTVITGMTQFAGKCLLGKNEILLQSGRLITVEAAYHRNEELDVLSLDDWKIVKDKVTHITSEGVKNVLRITTEDRRSVSISHDHPLRGIYGWVKAEHFNVGDYVAVPRTLEILELRKELLPSVLIVMAHLITDGTLGSGSPKFTNSDPEVLKDMNENLNQHGLELYHVGGIDYNIHQIKTGEQPFRDERNRPYGYWKKFCDEYDLKLCKAAEKEIPSCVFEVGRDQLRLFLNRLFGNDGSYERRHRISYSSMSPRLLRQVQHLLLRFGIKSRIVKPVEMIIVSEDTNRFIEEIGLFGKEPRLDEKFHSGTYDIIPIKRIPHLKQYKDHWIRAGYRKGFSSRRNLKRWAEYSDDKDLLNLAESDVYWVKVKKIEHLGQWPTYDVMTEKTGNLIINDIFVHNTTGLEALVERGEITAMTFLTKRGESGFRNQREIQPYFKEQKKGDLIDWQYVEAILEAVMSEKMKIERSFIITSCKGAHSLNEVYMNIKEMQSKHLRGFDESIYTNLGAYFEIILPQIKKYEFANSLKLEQGINVMNLIGMKNEMQQLVIESVFSYVLNHLRGVVVVLPEAHKFIPQGRKTPVKGTAIRFIQEGAVLGNMLWLDSQVTTTVDKNLLKQCSNWIMGYQQEKNEVANVRENIGKGNVTEEQIMTLKRGHFIASLQQNVYHVYLLPSGIDPQMGRDVALGLIPPEDVMEELAGIRGEKTLSTNFTNLEPLKLDDPVSTNFEGSTTKFPSTDEEEVLRLRQTISEMVRREESYEKNIEVLKKKAFDLTSEVEGVEEQIKEKKWVIENLKKDLEIERGGFKELEEDHKRFVDFDAALKKLLSPYIEGFLQNSTLPEFLSQIQDKDAIRQIIKEELAKMSPKRKRDIAEDDTGIAWVDLWLPKLGTAEQKILRFMAEKFPLKMTRSQIALGIRLTTKGGYFNGAFNKLRKNGLIISAGGGDWTLSEGPK